jgi:uncharacterized FAD-dependent dehydrogenase
MKIRVRNLRHSPPETTLSELVALRLDVDAAEVLALDVVKTSVDSRHHRPIRVHTVDVDLRVPDTVLERFRGDPQIALAPPPREGVFGGPRKRRGAQPLVVGTGPAGLFAALALAEKGYRPLVIERGKSVRPRWKDVNAYWRQGVLDPESNVAFGDGGAGTFSDGKLYTRRNDPRNAAILGLFAELGEAPDVLVEARPHLGTNRLSRVLLHLHERLERAGVVVRYESRLEDVLIEGGCVRGAMVNGERIETDAVFLAAGHSARDVFRLLHARGVAMEARPFAVGARAEHPQSLINRSQRGTDSPESGPADYMMSYNDEKRGRSAYTFCMCPGGEVVAAGTEADGLTVNGMSYSHRADQFGNSAVVATVTPEDFGGGGPLAGIEFQRRLEVAAFLAGGGGHVAPAQRIPDFLAGRPSLGEFETSYRRGVRAGDLTALLPPQVVSVMRRGIRSFGRLVNGFDGPWGVLIGLETRTSSPVRVLRDPVSYESVNVLGLYPIGEGAGYAGGITSSASDGLRAVERVEAVKE